MGNDHYHLYGSLCTPVASENVFRGIFILSFFLSLSLSLSWRNIPQWIRATSSTRFLDHTQRRTTLVRTPLDEWSARRRDLYLTTQRLQQTNLHAPLWDSNTQSQQASGLLWRPEKARKCSAAQGPHSEVVPRAFWRLVSKSCDECKGSFARGCEAKQWSHWTCSSLGTIFQPMRINSVPDVKCFCNNKNVLFAQSMVWHFVCHPVVLL